MEAREAAQRYAVPAVLSPPSPLLATSGDDKVTLRRRMVREDVFLFINNISYHQIPKPTEGPPLATPQHFVKYGLTRYRQGKESITSNWFCSGQNGGLSKPPVHFTILSLRTLN